MSGTTIRRASDSITLSKTRQKPVSIVFDGFAFWGIALNQELGFIAPFSYRF